MTKNYIARNDTIIFDPKYNKPLSRKLLSPYKKLIFSNYELTDYLFEAYENKDFKYLKPIDSLFNQPLANSLDNCTELTHIIFGSDFNRPLANSLNNCTALTHIVFGWSFNYPLANSLDNCTSLTHIIFGDKFNRPLANSLSNCTKLTHIIFGFYFNQPLTNSLDNCTALTHILFSNDFNHPLDNLLNNCTSLVHLKLGYYFDQQDEIPSNVRSLSLNCNNIFYTEHLPDTIEELELEYGFNLDLYNCSSSIKKITFDIDSKYNKKLNCLPNGLEMLQLPANYKQQIENIPPGLTKLICSENYPYKQDFCNAHVETY